MALWCSLKPSKKIDSWEEQFFSQHIMSFTPRSPLRKFDNWWFDHCSRSLFSQERLSCEFSMRFIFDQFHHFLMVSFSFCPEFFACAPFNAKIKLQNQPDD